jgi:hypothetical protein
MSVDTARCALWNNLSAAAVRCSFRISLRKPSKNVWNVIHRHHHEQYTEAIHTPFRKLPVQSSTCGDKAIALRIKLLHLQRETTR